MAILASPKFLYRAEPCPKTRGLVTLIASATSSSLRGSRSSSGAACPTRSCCGRAEAARARLCSRQVRRMLADPRVEIAGDELRVPVARVVSSTPIEPDPAVSGVRRRPSCRIS